MRSRKQVTKPRQAGSARSLDRWQLQLTRIHVQLMRAMKLTRDLRGALARAERR